MNERRLNIGTEESVFKSDPFENGTLMENGLFKCHECGRCFNERAFVKHPEICKRVF